MTEVASEGPIVAWELLERYENACRMAMLSNDSHRYIDENIQIFAEIRQAAKKYVLEHGLQNTPMERYDPITSEEAWLLKLDMPTMNHIESKIRDYAQGHKDTTPIINNVLRDLGRAECWVELAEAKGEMIPPFMRRASLKKENERER